MADVQPKSDAPQTGIAGCNVNVENPLLPTFQKLSQINGRINRLHKDEIVSELGRLNLNTRGNKDVLKKRLKTYYKRTKLEELKHESDVGYRYIAVLDFEATCEQDDAMASTKPVGVYNEFPHEIIEFPTILVDLATGEMCERFRRMVRPQLRPKLSEFCKDLTGIRQAEVDKASDFATVFQDYIDWLEEKTEGQKYAFASHGPFDIDRFLYLSCILNKVRFPKQFKKFIDLRKAFASFYGQRRCGINRMLEHVGMSFHGREHSGIDDTTNLARIVQRMNEDGYQWKTNCHICSERKHHLRKLGLHWSTSVEERCSSTSSMNSDRESDKDDSTQSPLPKSTDDTTYASAYRSSSDKENDRDEVSQPSRPNSVDKLTYAKVVSSCRNQAGR